MSNKYHISDNGEPSKCNAQPGNCPLGGEHFTSKQDAEAHFEKLQKNQEFSSISKSKTSNQESLEEENTASEFSDSTELHLWASMGTNEINRPAVFEAELNGPESVKRLDALVAQSGGDPKNEVAIFVVEEDYSEDSKLRQLIDGHDETYDAAKQYVEAEVGDPTNLDQVYEIHDKMLDNPKFYAETMSKYFRSNDDVDAATPSWRVFEGDKNYVIATASRDSWESGGGRAEAIDEMIENDVEENQILFEKEGSKGLGSEMIGISESYSSYADDPSYNGVRGKELAEKLAKDYSNDLPNMNGRRDEIIAIEQHKFELKNGRSYPSEKFYGIRHRMVYEGDPVGTAYTIIRENDTINDLVDDDKESLTQSKNFNPMLSHITDAEGWINYRKTK